MSSFLIDFLRAFFSFQVTASAAHKRRVVSAKKNDNNVLRRGLVEDPSIEVQQWPFTIELKTV